VREITCASTPVKNSKDVACQKPCEKEPRDGLKKNEGVDSSPDSSPDEKGRSAAADDEGSYSYSYSDEESKTMKTMLFW